MTLHLMMMLALSVGAEPAKVDLSRIDRGIKKEPRYPRGPVYCLLVFGPEARHRVWLVVDGDHCYVDRNGNGDLTEPGESVVSTYGYFHLGDIAEQGTKAVHKSLKIYRSTGNKYRLRVASHRLGAQFVGYRDEKRVTFASSRKEAPVIHFDGPLTLTRYSTIRPVPRKPEGRNYRDTWLRVMIGTPGIGEGTFAACHYRCAKKCGRMKAEIRFVTMTGKTKESKQMLETRN